MNATILMLVAFFSKLNEVEKTNWIVGSLIGGITLIALVGWFSSSRGKLIVIVGGICLWLFSVSVPFNSVSTLSVVVNVGIYPMVIAAILLRKQPEATKEATEETIAAIPTNIVQIPKISKRDRGFLMDAVLTSFDSAQKDHLTGQPANGNMTKLVSALKAFENVGGTLEDAVGKARINKAFKQVLDQRMARPKK